MTGSNSEGAAAREGSEEIFQLLELAPGQAAALEVRESDVRLAGGAVAHAIDGQGRRLLLVPLEEGEAGAEDVASRGVTLRPRQLLDGNRERRYIAVTCELPALRDLFSVVADEMLAAMRSSSASPGSTCQVVLDRWRDLLAPPDQRLLAVSTLAGLLAELHFLERLAALDAAQALRCWTGPGGGRFDFMGEGASAEVKATTTRDSIEVEIHGALQLDVPSGSALFVYAEQLERVPTGGDSVPSAAVRLRHAGLATHELLRSLSDVGYFAADELAYEKIRFDVLASRCFEVVDDFPRIVPGALKDPKVLDRVTRLRYTIDLTDESAVPGTKPLEDVIGRIMEPAS